MELMDLWQAVIDGKAVVTPVISRATRKHARARASIMTAILALER